MPICSYPQRIVVELTPRCDLSCAMCPRHYISETNGTMREKLWRKIIDEVANVSPQAIVLPFWRGESLLHPDFIFLLEYALEKNIRIHIATNGIQVKEKTLGLLLKCEFVTFSIHTLKAYVHAQELLVLRKGGKPVIQVSFVREEKRTENLLKQIVHSKDLKGFDSARIYEPHSKNGVFGKAARSELTPRTFCLKLKNTLVIAHDGSISRCNHIWLTEKSININDVSIKDAWESAYMRSIRNGYPDAQCQSCDQWIGHTTGEAYSMDEGKVVHKIYSSSAVRNA